MRENEFEQQVQQKMGEFNLHPSEEVWREVERRIRDEKKRRFIFWWPILFLLVSGGIAFGILFTNKKEKSETIVATKKAANLLPSTSGTITLEKPVNNLSANGYPDTAINKNIALIVKERKQERISIPATTLKTPERKKVTETIVKLKNEGGKKDDNNDLVNKEMPMKDQENVSVVSANDPVKLSAPSKDSTNANNITDGATMEIVELKKLPPPPPQQLADSVIQDQATKPVKKKASKWDWSVAFSAGRSSVGNGLNFSSRKSNEAAFALQSSSPVNLYNSSVTSIRTAFSWAGGIYGKQILSKKLHINLGLSYSYLSTKRNVGNRVDSLRIINNSYSSGLSVNSFYRPASTISYTDQYHFIHLSGDLAWRIINGKKIKLYWENGFGYSRMIGSNMLHVDLNLPGFYKDNSLLTKNNLFFTSGLSMPIGKRVVLNPFASYSLTRVLKNSDSIQTNYRNVGIRVRFLLNKK